MCTIGFKYLKYISILLLDKVCMLNAPMCHFIEQPKAINAKGNKGEEPPFNITTK